MRTKHILTALAIPALFAACVADDFNESIATGGDSAQRALLSEDFKLDFGGVDTRFSAGDADDPLYFSYEVGDTIGGSIIDEYHPGQPDEFPVVPYVSTNHPFVLNSNGEWAINHTMVEGHYLFYYPYNENNHARTAAQYSIPVLQDLAGKDGKFDPKAAVEKYNMGVGVQFLEKTDLNASLQLVNIFGFAKIKVIIDNHYAGGYVDKIVLQAGGGESFALNGQISNEKVNNLFKNLETSTQDYQDALKLMDETANFALDATSTGYYDQDLNKTSPVMVAKAPEGTALVADAQNNKTFETYMVVPAASYTNEVTLYIYTTEGNVYAGKIANFDVTRNGIKSITVSVGTPDEIPYVVTSEEDWNSYVALLSKNQNDEPGNLGAAKFIIAGSDFTITNSTKYPTNGAEIEVEGDLTVSGNNVTMKNVSAENVIVAKGAKLTTDGTFAAESIENQGTLVFAPKYDETDKDEVVLYGEVDKVSNEPGAALSIMEKAIVSFELENKIDNKDAALPHGAVTVDGMLTLEGSSTNNGDITVAATGSLRGTFTNDDETTYPVGATTEEDIKNRYTPTITNNGEIFVNGGVVVNNGRVVNNANAEISCSTLDGTSAFNNKGIIELGNNSDMLITDNDGGEIILSALDQTGWAVENANGTVSYKTTSADNGKSYDFSTVGTQINKLYVTGDLGFTKYGKLDDVEVTANATLNLPVSTVGTLAKLTIKEGVTVTAVSKDASVGTLVVEKNARLTVNAENKMTTTRVENSGRVYVGGTFVTAMLENDAADFGGEFRNTVGGDNGNIQFGEVPESDEKKAFDKALQDLVYAYVTNTSAIGNGTITSWAGVTIEAMQGVTWGSSWAASPWNNVKTAYKALNGADYTGSANDLLAANEKVITAAIATEKTKANTALAEAMAKITPETWLSSDVYVKASATAEIKKADGTTLKEGWVAYINGTFAKSVVGSNKPLYLSAMDYEDANTDVPAYSYINGYAAGEGDYEVMEALIGLVAENMDWFGAGSPVTKYTADDFKTYEKIREAMILIYNKKNDTTDPILPSELKAINDSKILDWYDDVVKEWLYTNNALEELNGIVRGN